MKNVSNWAFLALLLAVLLAVPAGTLLWGREDTISYYESRSLAAFPPVTEESLLDGSWGADFERWYSDHVPARTTLLKNSTAAQMKLRPVVNQIYVDGERLLPFLDYQEWAPESYPGPAAEIAGDFKKLADHTAESGGAFYYVGFPEQRVYFRDCYPDYLSSHSTESDAADRAFREAMDAAGVPFLDMDQLYERLGRPESFYSKVDHHYHYRGTYVGYRAIMDWLRADGWDLPVLREEDLTLKELPNPYIGSRNRKLYNLWPHTEKAMVGVQRDPVPFTRTDNGISTDKPLFVVRDDPSLPTTYDLYMGGDFGETILRTDRPELPDALVVGDSFTNAMETLLYASFDEMRSLDLRHYDAMSLKDYISDYQPDIVLYILNDTNYYTRTGNGAVWEE